MTSANADGASPARERGAPRAPAAGVRWERPRQE